MVASPHSTPSLHLSLFPPSVFPLSFTDCFLPSLYHPISFFLLPVSLSLSPSIPVKRNIPAKAEATEALCYKRPLQQESVLLEFPVALLPGEIQMPIKAKWAKQDCDWCMMRFLCRGLEGKWWVCFVLRLPCLILPYGLPHYLFWPKTYAVNCIKGGWAIGEWDDDRFAVIKSCNWIFKVE